MPNDGAEQPTGCQAAGGRLLFIGGLHRSGTTLLARALAEHPSVSGFRDTGVPEDEGQHLQSIYPSARAHGGPGRFGYDASAHLTERSELVSSENAERLFAQWAPYWNLQRDVLVEKSPPNLIRMRFLQALFPGSSFVMIVRHPVPVALATRRWSGGSLDRLLRHWLHCHDVMREDAEHVQRLLVLRYEELIEHSATVLEGVLRFAGLAGAVAAPVQRGLNDRYHDEWAKRYRRPLGPMIQIAHRRLARRFAAFGYSLEDPLPRPPTDQRFSRLLLRT